MAALHILQVEIWPYFKETQLYIKNMKANVKVGKYIKQ